MAFALKQDENTHMVHPPERQFRETATSRWWIPAWMQWLLGDYGDYLNPLSTRLQRLTKTTSTSFCLLSLHVPAVTGRLIDFVRVPYWFWYRVKKEDLSHLLDVIVLEIFILLVWTWGSWGSCSEPLSAVRYWLHSVSWPWTEPAYWNLKGTVTSDVDTNLDVLVTCHAWVGIKSSVIQPYRRSLWVDQKCSWTTEWEEITPKAGDWAGWRCFLIF